MQKIIRGFVVSVLVAALFGIAPMAIHAGNITLPHMHDFDKLAPWSKVYTGSSIANPPIAAPGSSLPALRFTYPKGFSNGNSTDKVWVNFGSTKTLWTQYYFMYSGNFYLHRIAQKQGYWYMDASNFFVGVTGTAYGAETRKMEAQLQRNNVGIPIRYPPIPNITPRYRTVSGTK